MIVKGPNADGAVIVAVHVTVVPVAPRVHDEVGVKLTVPVGLVAPVVLVSVTVAVQSEA